MINCLQLLKASPVYSHAFIALRELLAKRLPVLCVESLGCSWAAHGTKLIIRVIPTLQFRFQPSFKTPRGWSFILMWSYAIESNQGVAD